MAKQQGQQGRMTENLKFGLTDNRNHDIIISAVRDSAFKEA